METTDLAGFSGIQTAAGETSSTSSSNRSSAEELAVWVAALDADEALEVDGKRSFSPNSHSRNRQRDSGPARSRPPPAEIANSDRGGGQALSFGEQPLMARGNPATRADLQRFDSVWTEQPRSELRSLSKLRSPSRTSSHGGDIFPPSGSRRDLRLRTTARPPYSVLSLALAVAIS
ncbi:hypothetical protein TIFTF001_005641 [Ficus carica]|uniref:Uncharacterized protein n=1 Tax=Ficus carica TaxID=3494 RepID=A0AA87ZP99_FICCA|nr:hypothetical protein TIFTF001_005641 [Ficus carica]